MSAAKERAVVFVPVTLGDDVKIEIPGREPLYVTVAEARGIYQSLRLFVTTRDEEFAELLGMATDSAIEKIDKALAPFRRHGAAHRGSGT